MGDYSYWVHMRRASPLNLILIAAGAVGLWWWRPRPLDDREWRFDAAMTKTGNLAGPQFMCFSPDGRFLAVSILESRDPRITNWSGPAEYRKEVQIWDVHARDRRDALPFVDISGFKGAARPELEYSPTGDALTVNTVNDCLRWNYLAGSRPVSTPPAWDPWPDTRGVRPGDVQLSTLISPDEHCLAAIMKPKRAPGYLRFWRLEEGGHWYQGKAVIPLAAFGGQNVKFLTMSRGSRRLAVVTADGKIHIFETANSERTAELTTSRQIDSVAFSQDQRKLLAVGAGTKTTDGEMSFWDVRTGRLLERHPAAEPLKFATYSPKGDWVAAAEGESRVLVRRVAASIERSSNRPISPLIKN